MAKSLFGGSVIMTGALLVGSLIFYAHPSIAEDLAGQNKQGQPTEVKTETAGTSLPTDNAQFVAAAEVNLPPAPVVNETDPGPPPPDLKKASALVAAGMFTATAYALHGRTSSGLMVARGLIAADGRMLPLGTRVRLEAGAYSGEYIVADHGGAVHGRKIDIWMPSAREALRFGRRAVKLTILSLGGNRTTTRH
jgi:3D (Asp-Asp-Asp) domain-containing protein